MTAAVITSSAVQAQHIRDCIQRTLNRPGMQEILIEQLAVEAAGVNATEIVERHYEVLGLQPILAENVSAELGICKDAAISLYRLISLAIAASERLGFTDPSELTVWKGVQNQAKAWCKNQLTPLS